MRQPIHIGAGAVVTGWFVVLTAVAIAAGQDVPPPPGAETPASQAPTFTAGTTLIPLDVRVLDSRGRPVTDLAKSDFTVTEDGTHQEIVHFFRQELTAMPEASIDRGPLLLRADRPTTLAPANSRTFLFVLGRGDLEGPSQGIDGIIHFVRDRLLPQDRVALLAWNRSTTFTVDHASALALLTRFKAGFRKVDRELYDYFRSPVYFYGDRSVMPAYIQKDIDQIFGGPEHAPMRTNNAQLQASSKMDQTIHDMYDALTSSPAIQAGKMLRDQMSGMSLEDFFSDLSSTVDDSNNLYAGIEYLRHVDGEKHLVWLTDVGLRLVGVMVPTEFERDIARTAADGRVVLDIVRAGGVEFASPLAAANRTGGPAAGPAPLLGGGSIWPAAASRTMAQLTGGRSDANRFPNSSISADAIDQGSRFQYLLGYTPSDQNWDGRFRTVTVTVDRPGVTVLVRGGYYARKDIGPLDRRGVVTHSRISAAAGDKREILDLAVRAKASVTGTPGEASVTIDATIDLTRVTFQPVAGRQHAEIEVQAFVLSKGQHPVGDIRSVVVLDYSVERMAAVRASGAPVTLVVPVTGLPDSVKLVAYDYADDLTGSVNLQIGK